MKKAGSRSHEKGTIFTLEKQPSAQKPGQPLHHNITKQG